MKIDLSKYDKLSDKQWEDKVIYRGLHIKYKYQLNDLKKLYPEKIGRLQDRYNLLISSLLGTNIEKIWQIVEIFGLDLCLNKQLVDLVDLVNGEVEFLENKIERLTDKYASTLKEIELRDNKLVVRKPKGTTYYIDLTNGNDDRTGLKIGPSTIDSTADTTHFVDDFLTGADDYINGSYVWNVTRGIGALISDFVAATDEVTLATPIAGMTAGDTYYILDAWLTLEKYTTTTIRSPGDIGKVRANTVEIPVGSWVSCDEDGTKEALITLKGCNSVDDPWGDASNVRPIIDCQDVALGFSLNLDEYWKIENLDIKRSAADTFGALNLINASHTIVENCRFYEGARAGIRINDSYRVQVIDCEFWDNVSYGISIEITSSTSSLPIIKGCTFNGGASGTLYGVYTANSGGGYLVLIDCSFGQTTSHGTCDVRLGGMPNLYTRNCIFDGDILYLSIELPSVHEKHEDFNQTFENQYVKYDDGIIERETTIIRPGGADSSLKMSPTSDVGLYRPLTIKNEYQIVFGAFKVWLSADVEKTINMYIRGFGWTGFPTAPQLFIRASYLSNAGTAARTELDSDEVIANNDDWVPFQVTLTPARDGFVYVDVFVGHYEASSGVYVDIKPVIT